MSAEDTSSSFAKVAFVEPCAATKHEKKTGIHQKKLSLKKPWQSLKKPHKCTFGNKLLAKASVR